MPSRDFARSRQFCKELGFTLAFEGGGVADFHFGHASVLLHDFCLFDPSGVPWRIGQNTG